VLRTTRVEARFSVNRLDSNKTRRGEARINYNFSLTRLGSIRFDVETSQGEVEARSRRGRGDTMQHDANKIRRFRNLTFLLINYYIFYIFFMIYFRSCHQAFKHIHAWIVSAERLHLFCVMRSVPPEKALSTGTLVAMITKKTN
jgi:hypothetical protein